MQKRALVINPWITDFKLYDEWMHPIGLYFLISLLKFNHWDVHYINCLERTGDIRPKRYSTGDFPGTEIPKPALYKNIHRKYKRYGISEELFINKLGHLKKPDSILLGSGMTYWIDGLAETVKTVKKIFPNIPLIIGGTAASLIPQMMQRRIPDVKIHAGPLSDKSISFYNEFDTVSLHGWEPECTGAFSQMKNLYHGPILTSLGCPFRCAYCASSHLQNKFQSRPHSLVVNEMQFLIEHFKITDFACYDDALLYQPDKNFLPLAQEIAQLNQKIRIHVPNGLNIRWINKKILENMKKCGFVTLRFGYESGNSKYRKETCSKASKKKLTEKISLIKSAGFNSKDIGIYVMGGLPNQTVEELLEELSFIASLEVKVKPVFLSPVPRTPLFEYYAQTFPELNDNPLFHNDLFFITQLPDWSYCALEDIKSRARELNSNKT